MKHRPSCRTAALITAATGTVLVSSAFGIVPAMATTAAPATSTSVAAADTASSTAAVAPQVAAPAAPAPSPAAAAPAPAPAPAAAAPEAPAPAASTAPAPAVTPAATPSTEPAPAVDPAPAATAPAPAETTPAATSGRQPTAPSTGTAAKPSKPGAHGHGHDEHQMPTYSSQSSQSSPVALPSVRAGEEFSADLRADHADGATYTLTTVEGGSVSLPEGLWFHDGVLGGTPTYAGTFTALVTATNDCGTASQWVRMTVTPAASLQLGVVVHDVPAASDGSYTWVAPDGSTSPGPIRVNEGGSITLVPWTSDEYGNATNASATAEVWSSIDSDVVVHGDSGFTITFPHASSHVISVTVDGVCTEFTVEVIPASTTPTTPTTPATPTTPTTPTTPEPPTTPVDDPAEPVTDVVAIPVVVQATPIASGVVGPVATATPVATADHLAYTGAETSTPIGWAVGLLAAGAALLGFRGIRTVRRRHRG